MAEFALPKNSKVKKGKVWPAQPAANGKKPKRSKDFKVYRYDPDSGENPTVDVYIWISTASVPMALDA